MPEFKEWIIKTLLSRGFTSIYIEEALDKLYKPEEVLETHTWTGEWYIAYCKSVLKPPSKKEAKSERRVINCKSVSTV